jgi:hypothetical protein
MYTYGVSLADDPAEFETFSGRAAAEDFALTAEYRGDDVVRWRAISDFEDVAGRVERPGWRRVDYFA